MLFSNLNLERYRGYSLIFKWQIDFIVLKSNKKSDMIALKVII